MRENFSHKLIYNNDANIQYKCNIIANNLVSLKNSNMIRLR